jgi:hypothetical protein
MRGFCKANPYGKPLAVTRGKRWGLASRSDRRHIGLSALQNVTWQVIHARRADYRNGPVCLLNRRIE